jgi:hypothetical protein
VNSSSTPHRKLHIKLAVSPLQSYRTTGIPTKSRVISPEKLFYAPFPILEALGSESWGTRLRADMVYFETGKGGAVFSASSVGWSGALSHNGDQNAASRLTANVLRSFIEVEPIVSR